MPWSRHVELDANLRQSRLNPTCPLDRQTLIKKKAPPPPQDDDEGEYDDMFG